MDSRGLSTIETLSKIEMPPINRPALMHLGIFTDHQEEMRAFYEYVLGLVVSDVGVAHKFKRRIVFMTGTAEHHHQFVLVARQPGDPPCSPVFQISFCVPSLAMLRAARARAIEAKATNFRPMNHGNSWSLYFNDPEGNTVEVYMETPWYVGQPFADDLDLDLPDEEIFATTERRLGALDTSQAAEAWSRHMQELLDARPYMK